ncbi:IS200/IS605 family transposase [Sediminibacterium soli]|uniref:IS200/IS605 family transposase n=1 Tax=Sediminibacterium soli TaxID=2698829 RepID=UPI00192A225D|nr:IS200/IS605 family transposase [Sediminibacterium soli]
MASEPRMLILFKIIPGAFRRRVCLLLTSGINTLKQVTNLYLLCGMSCTQVCIHYVWATRSRRPTLVMPCRGQLFTHIRENALLKGIHLDRINGHTDHVHCLVWLQPAQSLASVAQQLKGESAYWFNVLSGINSAKLQWQESYFAASVSLSGLSAVRKYIDNQEAHHAVKTFEKEYDELMREYLFIKDLDNSIISYRRNIRR